MDDNSAEIIRSISESNLSFKYADLRKATDNFDQRNKLGQGGYGSVYKVVNACNSTPNQVYVIIHEVSSNISL